MKERELLHINRNWEDPNSRFAYKVWNRKLSAPSLPGSNTKREQWQVCVCVCRDAQPSCASGMWKGRISLKWVMGPFSITNQAKEEWVQYDTVYLLLTTFASFFLPASLLFCASVCLSPITWCFICLLSTLGCLPLLMQPGTAVRHHGCSLWTPWIVGTGGTQCRGSHSFQGGSSCSSFSFSLVSH